MLPPAPLASPPAPPGADQVVAAGGGDVGVAAQVAGSRAVGQRVAADDAVVQRGEARLRRADEWVKMPPPAPAVLSERVALISISVPVL